MTEQVPENPHTAFVTWMFAEASHNPFVGIFSLMFKLYSRVMVKPDDFAITFVFKRGEWHIKVAPKSVVGKFAIQSMREVCIQSELAEANNAN